MRHLAPMVVWLCTLAGMAGAQVITPITGEHADFTRIVLRLPADTGWSLSPEGRQRQVTIAGDGVRFNLDAVFRRIPRSRLADMSAQGAVLTLDLACDCPIRAFEDRPGLVILDIRNPAPEIPEGPPPALTPPALTPPAPRPVAPDPLVAARLAGEALARARPAPAAEPAPDPAEDPRLATLAADLGRSVASALGQGILDPAIDGAEVGAGLLDATPQPDLPANMRIATVRDRDDPGALAPQAAPAICQGSEILDQLLGPPIEDWSETHGRLTRALYGEFDQPDPRARFDLIGLYLASGFGAEARALLANSPDPVAGRDFALGLADVFEDRASNSRMRLAQAIDCGAAASVMAVLAGADDAGVQRQADRVALTFTTLSPRLRGLTGAALVARLADTGMLDAARIVAESLRHSEWASPPDLALVAARLDRARGLPQDAAARLAHEGGADTETLQTRLDLALQTRSPLGTEVLAGAEALAAMERGAAAGPELMASVVRLHARSGASPDAFAALDRLESWMSATGENRRLLGGLRNEVWGQLAQTGSDFGIVEAILARDDWRGGDLDAPTRLVLAGRLLDLGLATPVLDLLAPLEGPQARVLQARALLETGAAAQALSVLGDDTTDEARRTRAAALDRLGDHAGAAAEFAALGIHDAEARAALLAGDWRRFEALVGGPAEAAAPGGDPRPAPAANQPPTLSPGPAPEAALAPMLGRAPGHAEIARSQPASAAAPGDAARQPVPGTPAAMAAAPAGADQPLAPPANGGGVTPAPAPEAPTATAPEPVTTPAPTLATAAAQTAPAAPPATPLTPAAATPPPAPGTAAAPLAAARAAPGIPTSVVPGVPPVVAPDMGAAFDRLGLVRRSSTLLAESERLRDALSPLIGARN